MATRKVTVRECKINGSVRWQVRFSQNGKEKRITLSSKEAADAEAEALREQIKVTGAVWGSLSAYERNNLISAYSEAKKLGVDIHKVILTAVNNGPVLPSLAIGKVITEMEKSRLNNGANAEYVKNLVYVLNRFAKGRETLEINKITLGDVEAHLDSKNLQYRQTLRGRLSTLFNFAVRRGYRADNPCDRLESVKVVRPAPAVFSVEQIMTAVSWLEANAPAALPWFALSAFCGLRPEEAEKTTKADIHFPEGFIRVEAQTTKVRQRRVVYPRPEAMAALEWALKFGSLPYSAEARRRMIGWSGHTTGLRKALGFTVWPKDITRHTAASYWLASDESVGTVSKMLGNSEGVLLRHYQATVTKAEAREFWKVVNDFSGKEAEA